jgi:cytidylate kinase
VVTISRQPGSNGRKVAKLLGDELGLQLFGSVIIDQVAQNAQISRQAVESLDERGHGFVENLLASLPGSGGLTDLEYIEHLAKILLTIHQHGDAVILGRGANFVVPPARSLRVRFVAPLALRIANVMEEFEVDEDEARRRIKTVASDRRRFVRLYFDEDIDDPGGYDLVINDARVSPARAVAIIAAALRVA